jgi:HAD domain in Swiss Army Knife RNA repair proteins
MKRFYKSQGIKAPIDYTTHIRKSNLVQSIEINRAYEINKWLEKHDVTHWVAIDDLDMGNYLTNFVKTDPSVGLTKEIIQEAMNYLSH